MSIPQKPVKLHPETVGNFDERASALRTRIEKFSFRGSATPTFPSEIPAVHLAEKDIIGDLRVGIHDYRGWTTAKYFIHGGKHYGIAGAGYLGDIRGVAHIRCLGRREGRVRMAPYRDGVTERVAVEF